MGTKTSCDYCDKVKENEQHFINVHIESSSALILSIDLTIVLCILIILKIRTGGDLVV